MKFGTQLVASRPFDSFVQGRRYYFAGVGRNDNAMLAFFTRGKHGRRVWLINLERAKLQELLAGPQPALMPLNPQPSLPEWLAEQEGIDWDHVEARRKAENKVTYRDQVDRTLFQLGEALNNETEILLSDNPLQELSRYSRECSERVHPHRFQVNFFAYVLHGREIWALKHAIGEKGKWDRADEKHGEMKFGRPSGDPENCFNAPSWKAKNDIVRSFLDRCDVGKTMASLHSDYHVQDLKCNVTKSKSGSLVFINPSGGPVYSYGTYRSVIVSELGLDAVQKTLYGEARVRAKKAADEGNFTAQYSTLMGGFETDLYYESDRPKAMFSDGPAEPLAVAVGLDGKTSGFAGLGFALGSETQEAYRSMLFFAVAPNSYLAKIYGVPVEHLDDWVVKGLPASLKSDRGPGGHQSLVDDLKYKFKLKSITPSWSGQSKAQVETTHPKSPKIEGEPSFVQSDLSVPQMMKRAIYRARAHNRGSDISARLSDQEILDFRELNLATTPDNYWTYCDERLMTSARDMPLEAAVRAFWTPIKFRVDSEGVRHRHRHFNSAQFKKAGLHERLARTPSIELHGYCLSTVFRSVWVEVEGKLIEVEATTRVQIDGEDQMIPLSEVEEVAAARRQLGSVTRRNAQAAAAEARIDFHTATGKNWSDAKRKRGKPKRGKGMAAMESVAAKGKTKDAA